MAPVLPIIESKVKKKPRTSSGPRRLIRWSFAATSSVRFARAADPLLSSNAQQDEDQKQNQRELHHESKVLQSRTQTLRARPGSVKAGGAGSPTRVGRRTGRSGPGQLNQRDLGRRPEGPRRGPTTPPPAPLPPTPPGAGAAPPRTAGTAGPGD